MTLTTEAKNRVLSEVAFIVLSGQLRPQSTPDSASLSEVDEPDNGLNNQPNDEPDTPDRLTAQSLKETRPVLDAWLAQIRDLMERSPSLEAFQSELFGLYGEMPNDDWVELMGREMAIAELAGRYEVIEEGKSDTVTDLDEPVEFARLKMAGNTRQTKQCKKGYSCGFTCIARTRNCRSPLEGQAKDYANWLMGQVLSKMQLSATHEQDAIAAGLLQTLNPNPQTFDDFIRNGREIVGADFFNQAEATEKRYAALDQQEFDYKRSKDSGYFNKLADYVMAQPEYMRLLEEVTEFSAKERQILDDWSAKKITAVEAQKRRQSLLKAKKKVTEQTDRLQTELTKEYETRDPFLSGLNREREQLDSSAQRLSDRLLKDSTLSREQALEKVRQIKMPRTAKKDDPGLEDNLVNLVQLTNGKGLETLKEIKFASAKQRGYASPSGLLATRKGEQRVLFHEFGHHVEFSSSVALDASKDWIKSRADSNPTRLSNLSRSNYRRDEVAYPDKFIDPYVGKIYSNATEVISMGLEHFASPRSLIKLAAADPDHLAYTVGIIRATTNV
jgi:hypothetical protein